MDLKSKLIQNNPKNKTKTDSKSTKVRTGEVSAKSYNLTLVDVEYDDDFYCIIDNKKYPLLWDSNNTGIMYLYSLPTNEVHPAWTCVEADIRYENLDIVFTAWSPIKPKSKVFVLIHKDKAIVSKIKKH